MKQRPMLFSGAMVRAILEGRKSITRRIVKPQPAWVYNNKIPVRTPDADPDGAIRCPYGQPGDRLWVRETFAYYRPFAGEPTSTPIYAADLDHCGQCPIQTPDGEVMVSPRDGWTPSIHMPRKVSRITLEITGVRVERLQDISEADALAEGVTWPVPPTLAAQGITEYRPPIDASGVTNLRLAANRYRELWELINGPGSWAANPWVWVVAFKRVTPCG